jgi:heme/copper-type cytochrome/quinol oxidase subunit 3
MVNWKRISLALFILSVLVSAFYFLTRMTAMYAPPEIMARETARRWQELRLVAAGVGILLVSSIISSYLGWKQEKSGPPREPE